MTRPRLCPAALLLLFVAPPCHAHSAPSAKTFPDHTAAVTTLAWSRDGKTVASGDDAGLVVLSDARTGKTRLRLKYRNAVQFLTFSPDSQRLAVGRDEEVRLLDARTGAPVRVFKTSADEAQFSRDGNHLTVTDTTGTEKKINFEMSVWDIATGKRLSHHEWPQKPDEFGDFSSAISQGGQGAVFNTAGQMRLYAPDKTNATGVWELNPKDEYPFVLQVAWSRDGSLVANTGGYYEGPGHIDIWNAKTHKREWALTIHDWAPSIAFSPHNRLLAVGTHYDSTYDETPRPHNAIFLYDLRTHKLVYTLKGDKDGENSGANALAWSPDGKRIAIASHAHAVRVWTLTGK